jgi:hypothetical protein
VTIAYRLVDLALKDGDLESASELMLTLSRPPEGIERFLWQLRRAKVFILAGEHRRAIELLTELTGQFTRVSAGEQDRYVQLLFDLQAVGENEASYRRFEALLHAGVDARLQREFLFWMGDSRQAQERYGEAALLYLRSADTPTRGAQDPWAQTARYQAAKALNSAGLYRDASQLLKQLLQVTESLSRRAVLLRELEQIRLKTRDRQLAG